MKSESEIRANEREAEWGRIYTTLCHGGYEDAAVYLESLSDPEFPPEQMFPRGCYYTQCDTACGICKENPAVVCESCVQFRRKGRRDDLRAEGAAEELKRVIKELHDQADYLTNSHDVGGGGAVRAAADNLELKISMRIEKED